MAISLGGLIILGIAALITLAVLMLVFGAVAWMLGLGRWNRGRANDTDDARVMQEIHRGLVHMEERLGSLETIMDKDNAVTATER